MTLPDFTKRIALWILKVSLLCPLTAYSQVPGEYGISPQTPLTECAVDQWTGDNGLLSNNLTSVFQASSGFLWITTNNGLMRFDGVNLQIFDQHKVPFFSTDAFYRIYEDKNRTLWLASRGSGIVTYSGNKFSQFLPDNPLVPKALRTMVIQDDGTIWAGSDYKGLVRIKDSTATLVPDPLLQTVSILSLEEGDDGTIYVGTNSRGLLALKDGKVSQISLNKFRNIPVHVVKRLDKGVVYIGTSHGLFILKDGVISAVDFLRNVQVNDIIRDRFGSVWVATERGLGRINEQYNVREFLRSGKGFPGAHITSLFIDREGSLWMSTGKSGLLRMKESPIRNYNEHNGLSIDRVNVVTEAPDGRFFISLDDGLVDIFDNGAIKPLPINNSDWNDSVRDLLIEPDGTIWIASYNGVLKKTRLGERLFTTEDGLSSNSVRRILRDSTGDLWFATQTGGVIRFRDDKVKQVFNREAGLSSDYIMALEQDAHGRLLVGAHSGGLNVIHPDGVIEVFTISGAEDGILIFNLDVDTSGNVWLATSNGLYHFSFESRVFTKIRLAEVIQGESFFDWVEDHLGNVWVPTNIGILQISKKEVTDFVDGKLDRVSNRIYDDFDGMKNKECTGATRSLLSSKGEVWVPTIAGVCVVNPERLAINRIVPPVYITAVVTDEGETTAPPEEVTIEPGNFRLTIRFTSLSLWAPNKVKFRYQLNRVDKDWKDVVDNERSVGYTNLSPGNYTFRVVASNNDGIWNQDGATLKIKVLPFFYQTAWFYIILASGSLVMIYLLYRWRVDAIEHRNQELMKVNSELDRFVYSASHDLRAPLTSILGLVRLTKLDDDPENRKQYLDMVEKSIHKLDGFIHDIINYSRNARTQLASVPVDFRAVTSEIFEMLSFQDNSSKIKKIINVTGEGAFYSDRKRLDIVLYNLVSNAIKYHHTNHQDPWIKIEVSYSVRSAVIKVIDNGPGIRKDHIDNIFKMFYRADERSSGSGLGLFIARETVEKLKGTITVDSARGKGSTFTVQIPSLPAPDA